MSDIRTRASGKRSPSCATSPPSLTARQRMLLGGGALLVAVVLFTFVHLLAKPEMTALYSNMEPADAQSLGQRLALKNIRYQLSPDGKSVLVPADQLDAARLEIASQGVPAQRPPRLRTLRQDQLGHQRFRRQGELSARPRRRARAHHSGDERRRSRARSSGHSARFHLLRTGSPGQGWSHPEAQRSPSLRRPAHGRATSGLQCGGQA